MAFRIRLDKSEDDSDLCHFGIAVAAGGMSGSTEFYGYADDLDEFGRLLEGFEGRQGQEPSFNAGAQDSAHWLSVSAYAIDTSGHSAIEVTTGVSGARHVSSSAKFSAVLEVATINRLGAELRKWARSGSSSFEFEAQEANVR
jgi:hypothetical protein